MEQTVEDMSVIIGDRSACKRVGFARATLVRHRRQREIAGVSRQVQRHAKRQDAKATRRASSLALVETERKAVLDAVHQFRFIDRSVPYIYSTLLDEGVYLCSLSTMYRILRSVGEVGERRDQATRPAHAKPELCATAPGHVFAWDIVRHEAL